MAHAGFTLVELMIVVVIVGTLAAIAATSYKKYSIKARNAEVMGMFGEFRAKEEAYRAEFGAYLSTGSSEGTYYPALTTSEPTAKVVYPLPATWTSLGINPQRRQLYCGYVAIAGAANTAPSGTDGVAIFSSFSGSKPPVPWFYLHGTCDNDGVTSVNAVFTTAMNTTSVVAVNENR